MNIFEELSESYTYNGAISQKAIEDDIVTLENHIDSLNSTLREINMRGKNPGPIAEKIRDEKIRLSLLRTFLKKVKEETPKEDEGILGVLGVSGKVAKEADKPETAANGREPKKQNFESTELGETEPENDIQTKANEIEVDEELEASTEIEQTNDDNEAVDNEEVTDEEIESNVEIGQFDDEPEAKSTEEESEEAPAETDAMVADLSDEIIDMRGASYEDLTDLYNSIKSDDKICIKGSVENGVIEVTSGVKPETELVGTQYDLSDGTLHYDIDLSGPQEDCDLVYIDGSEETELPECPPPTLDDYMEPDDGVVADEFDDAVSDVLDFNTVYDAFPDDVPTIGASLDLSRYTNMVNTCNIYVTVNHEDSELHVRFDDIRDYEIFVSLAKEYEDMKRNPLKRLFKKGKSIFMSVTAKHDEETGMNYEYMFSGCKLKGVSSSGYPAVKCGCSDVPAAVNDFISCYATFKYKKMKVVKIKWYSLSPEKKRPEQR